MPMPDLAQPQVLAQPHAAAGSFVVGPENALVRELAQAVTTAAVRYNPLVLCGASGLGKSTLAHLLANRRAQALSLAHCLKTTGADLARALAHAAETNSVADLRSRHQRCDLLLVDDVHQLANRSAAQQFLAATLDALVRRGVLVLVTLPQLPQSIDGLLPMLASRLNAGLIVPLAPPEELARREIVRQLAERLELRLSGDSLAQLADAHGRRGTALTVPRLRSTLLQLASASTHGRQENGLALVAQVLDAQRPEAKAVVRQAIATVAKHFALSMAEVKGKSRQQTTVEARSLAMYLSRELTDLTLAQIGRLFGNRDHTTVLHAYRKIATLVGSDAATARLVQELKDQIAVPTA